MPRSVKIEFPENPFVTVRRLQPFKSVACGMTVEYEICYRPENDKDDATELIVATDRERFTFPLIARGRRLELELPDVIDCGKAPVKGETTRSYLLTNVGCKKGRFSIAANDPFDIHPSRCELDIDASIQCAIRFHPQTVGLSEGRLTIEHENGDQEHVELKGNGLELDIEIPRSDIQMEPTFITHSSSSVCVLRSHSAMCMRFVARSTGGGFFTVHPTEGVIPPFAVQQWTVEFSPMYARSYVSECVVELEGREDPVRFTIHGIGLGAEAGFEKETIDIGDVYIHTVHSFNAVLINRGEIPASFQLHPRKDALCTCAVEEGRLLPGECEKIPVY